jgi:signal peptidase I
VAGLISGLCPGLGHFLLRRWSRGLLSQLAFWLTLFFYWWLRLPKTFIGATVAILAIMSLCGLSSWDSAYSHRRDNTKPSKWWLALLLPISLLAGNMWSTWLQLETGFRAYSIPVRSMAPTMPLDSHIMVDCWYYKHNSPKPGDIIAFSPPSAPIVVVKRVIAVGGDTIEVRGDTVVVNGKVLAERYAAFEGPLPDVVARVAPISLPMNTAFVMGDNRHDSYDSRMYGPIPISAIRGRVLYAFSTSVRDLTRSN